MATLSVQSIVEAGLGASYSAAAELGDTFVNDGSEKQFIHVKNANVGASRTVTVAPVSASTTKPGYGTLTRASIEVTIAASSEKFIGPFPHTAFGNPDIQYDDHTDVTIAVVKI